MTCRGDRGCRGRSLPGAAEGGGQYRGSEASLVSCCSLWVGRGSPSTCHRPGPFGKGAAGPCLGGLPLHHGHEEGEPLPLGAHTDPAPPAAGTAGEEALQPARNPPQDQPCASPKAGPLSPSTIKSSHLHWVIPLSFVSHPPLLFWRAWDQWILFFPGTDSAFPALAGLGSLGGGHGTASACWAALLALGCFLAGGRCLV